MIERVVVVAGEHAGRHGMIVMKADDPKAWFIGLAAGHVRVMLDSGDGFRGHVLNMLESEIKPEVSL